MRKSLLFSLLLLSAGYVNAYEHQPHWSYEGKEAPEHWGELSADYALCQAGKNQSPVDIRSATHTQHEALTPDYHHTENESIVNNGHAVQINVASGNTLKIDGDTFTLQQFHFHTPSENTIDGKSFPMEVHFVHTDEEGEVAVVAVMFTEGKANTALAETWSALPEALNKPQALPHPINLDALLPDNKDYYRFSGSLTTPPCTEGVRWIVMKNPVSVSAEQIKALKDVLHHNNNRPIQPLHGRVITD